MERRVGNNRGFTLIELLVVVAIIALLISILLPSLSRARETAKRTVCASNIKSIITACKTYAHDHNGLWPSVAYGKSNSSRFYDTMGGYNHLPRNAESKSDGGSVATPSLSRAMWQLIRLNSAAGNMFICPSSDDVAEEEGDVVEYYDFKGYGHLSYGYQHSYLARNSSKAREDRSPRMVLVGDKSPSITRSEQVAHESSAGPSTKVPGFRSRPLDYDLGTLFTVDNGFANDHWPDPDEDAIQLFGPFNSPNHGGRGSGEGQNVGRADGSVEFVKTPLAGVNQENIYSGQTWGGTNWEFGIYRGIYPPLNGTPPVPGNGAAGYPYAARHNGTTDTLLFP